MHRHLENWGVYFYALKQALSKIKSKFISLVVENPIHIEKKCLHTSKKKALIYALRRVWY